MRAGGNLLADILELPFEVFPSAMHETIAREQLKQDGKGDQNQAPGHAEADAGGDMQDRDGKTDERKNGQQGEGGSPVQSVGIRMDHIDVEGL